MNMEERSRSLKLLELKKEIEKYDYIRFTCIDLVGRPKGKLIPARNAYNLLESGLQFYGGLNAIGSNADLIFPKEVIQNNYGNAKMMPDLDTFHPLPWLGSGRYKTAQIFIEPGNNTEIDKSYRSAFSRVVACEQLKKLDDLGYAFKTGIEWEYLLLNKETGDPVFKSRQIHSTLVQAEFEDWFIDVDKSLYNAGVNVDSMMVENSPGQFEFCALPEYGIKSADCNVIMKQCLKEMASMKGWQANFMAKFSNDQPGNGAHFCFSLWDKKTGANAFYDEAGPNKLSSTALHWIEGITKHAPALTALCCPTTNCYHRIHLPLAPDLINWGIDNRMAMLRVKNDGINGTFMENRMPSALANVYLVMAGNLAAGIDGIVNKLPCPEPDLTTGIPALPYTLEEALQCLEEDHVMVEALGKTFVEWFALNKRMADIKATEGVEDEAEILKIERKVYGRTC